MASKAKEPTKWTANGELLSMDGGKDWMGGRNSGQARNRRETVGIEKACEVKGRKKRIEEVGIRKCSKRRQK